MSKHIECVLSRSYRNLTKKLSMSRAIPHAICLAFFTFAFYSKTTFAQSTSGCTYPAACNFNVEATVDDGTCVYPDFGYDCDGNCLLDLNNNGLCDLEEVAGCINSDAVNYDAGATLDDGSCVVTCKGDFNNDGQITTSDLLSFLAAFGSQCSGGGCMDPDGCNYDPEATFDFDYCEYAEEFYDCDGVCLNDADGDGICDELEVPGCTDPEANNYDPEATEDDGSCDGGAPQYPVGTVFCNDTPTAVVEIMNPETGKVWMDRNLGASEPYNGENAAAAEGDLYQWGRGPDGHQCRNSVVIYQLSSTNQPGHGMFICNNNDFVNDWRSPQNMHLWQGVNGINVPCPEGYRLPTEAEVTEERLTWESNNMAGATLATLKWLPTGRRHSTTGNLLGAPAGNYWTSTTGTNSSQLSKQLNISSSNANVSESARGDGRAIRCIKH